MGFKCGIVGLPNVGKSTLFNALTSSKNAQAENFPFCTIDPNIGIVDVPDTRLNNLSVISKSSKKINANITFVDIAGLVKGASKGEGLGNKFLSHIREVDAIVHLVRCFDSENIQHVNKKIDPINDLETIKTEILLADIKQIEKKLEKNAKKKLTEKQIKLLNDILAQLNKAERLDISYDSESKKFITEIGLISNKPYIIVCNVDEQSVKNGNNYTKLLKEKFPNQKFVSICADIESQIIDLKPEERENYMKNIGLEKTGLDKLITSGYDLLNLNTFFTSGPKETRAWTIKKNTVAQKAAGVIHSDFEKNFIRAEVVSYDDFDKYGSFEKAKENGKLKVEGKNYFIKDGDVLIFRVNP
ncbi:MAG: redox-regulated ATPase YchF [Candidatus Pelagibacter sp. TMED196]|nr:MAG: redox-regulated ATPase YchF [Candidatus Pelagibacter sp. TMED196]|tara:strand:+ start:515 stop:1588 length:1074 start_codon:yes stop_codon:yes gene_type:complete